MPLSKEQKLFYQPQLIHLLSTVGPQRKEDLPAQAQAQYQEKFSSIHVLPGVPQLGPRRPQHRIRTVPVAQFSANTSHQA